MRALGIVLVTTAILVGLVAGLWTVWRAVGAEVDYCGGGAGDCTSAYAITVPALALAAVAGIAGFVMLRRSHR